MISSLEKMHAAVRRSLGVTLLWAFSDGPTPEELAQGGERIYLEHYWNDFAADKMRSIPETSRAIYSAADARPGRMRTGSRGPEK